MRKGWDLTTRRSISMGLPSGVRCASQRSTTVRIGRFSFFAWEKYNQNQVFPQNDVSSVPTLDHALGLRCTSVPGDVARHRDEIMPVACPPLHPTHPSNGNSGPGTY